MLARFLGRQCEPALAGTEIAPQELGSADGRDRRGLGAHDPGAESSRDETARVRPLRLAGVEPAFRSDEKGERRPGSRQRSERSATRAREPDPGSLAGPPGDPLLEGLG